MSSTNLEAIGKHLTSTRAQMSLQATNPAPTLVASTNPPKLNLDHLINNSYHDTYQEVMRSKWAIQNISPPSIKFVDI